MSLENGRRRLTLRDALARVASPRRFASPNAAGLLRRAERRFEKGESAAAVASLLEMGEKADPAICLVLGDCYERGVGAMQNFVSAARWYERAAERGLAAAMSKLGDMYFAGRVIRVNADATAGALNAAELGSNRLRPKGMSVPRDFAKALHWNAMAAEAGLADAQARLGCQYASGLGAPVDYATAEYWFAAATAQENAAGQFGLGLLYAGGYLGKADEEKAAAWFDRAACRGNAAAKLCLARLLIDGKGVSADWGRAANLLEESASANQTEAMFLLGQLYQAGRGVPQNVAMAETWLRRAGARGHIQSLLMLAQLLLSDLATPDAGSAAIILREAADLGDAQAQFALGRLYDAGRGVPRDSHQAAAWFRKAADQGVIGAIEQLGVLHVSGRGADQDFAIAFQLFERAAAEGSATADYTVAGLLFEGIGVDRDPKAAIERYLQAADKGSAAACLRLGVLYATGDHVGQDYAMAADWYGKAHALGDLNAKCNLAFLHIRGLGLDRAPERGIAMLEEAAISGHLAGAWGLYHLYDSGVYVPTNAAESGKWLERAAELGSGEAACLLTRRLLDRHADSPAIDRSIGLLKAAAGSGDSAAQAMLGRLLFEGRGVSRDSDGALRWMTASAENGNVFAQAWMGDVLSTGQGVLIDSDAATFWYEKAAAQLHTGALMVLTGMAAASDPRSDACERLFSLWLKAAAAGDERAEVQVADMYMNGLGVEESPAEAMRWLRSACAKGNAAAQVSLGGLLLTSREDAAAEAVGLFRRAAAQGHPTAGYNLGVCYRRGLGVSVDNGAAQHWYRAAAAQGQSSAQLALADLLAEIGDPQSVTEAVKWYQQAANAALPGASYALGLFYEEGRAVGKDREMAVVHYRKAADSGHSEAKNALDRLLEGQPI